LPLLGKNQQSSNAMPPPILAKNMGKQQTPPLEQPIFIQLVRFSTNPIQTANGYNNDDRSKCGTTAAGLELFEQMCFGTVRVRVNPFNVMGQLWFGMA